MAIPHLQYLLRTSPCFQSHEATHLDDEGRSILSSMLNLKLEEAAWTEASLPVRWGGVGVKKASTLATSAFLALQFPKNYSCRLIPSTGQGS